MCPVVSLVGVTNRWVEGSVSGDYFSPGIRVDKPFPIVEASVVELCRRDEGEINLDLALSYLCSIFFAKVVILSILGAR